MPAYPEPSSSYFANLMAQIKQQLGALSSGGTSYIIDPTITNASPTTPNCMLIIGDVRHDNFHNSTGLPASGRSPWGIAVFNTTAHTWSQI